MEWPLDQLRDMHAMEPSPSPPVTARVLVPPSHIYSSRQPSAGESCEGAPASSQRQTPSPLNSNPPLTRHNQRHMHAATAQATFVGERMTEEAEEERASLPRNSSTRTSPRSSAPLALRSINVAPASQPKGRPASLSNIRAPDVEWVVQMSERRSEGEGPPPTPEEEQSAYALVPSPRQAHSHKEQLRRRRSSGSSTSAACRLNVIGPDLRDCIDLCESECTDAVREEDEPQEMRVAPLPHELYQRHPQQRRAPAPTAVAADDLAVLVSADTVERCRSDSRGQICLVDDSDLTAESALPDRRCAGSLVDEAMRRTAAARLSASIRAPTEFPGEGEERVGVGVGEDRGSVASSSPPVDTYADRVFALDYYYYHTAVPNDETAAEGEFTEEAKDKTPAHNGGGGADEGAHRRTSASPSSSVPRWARSIAEETPFTPFAFAPPCPAAAGAATASSTPSPPVTPNAPHAKPEEAPIGSSAANHFRVSILDGLTAGAQERLTVQEVVAAVLAALPPPPSLPPAVQVREVALEKEDVDIDGPFDEPAPRIPAEGGAFHGCQSSSQSQRQRHAEQLEREQLIHRIGDGRAHLSSVDRLVGRVDAVIESRKTELKALKEKQEQLKQQTEGHKARTAIAQKEIRRLRDRQHAQAELQLLRDMLVDKENQLSVAQSQLLSLKRLRQQLSLLHAASAEKSRPASERLESSAAVPVSKTVSMPQSAQLLPPSLSESERRGALLPLSPPSPAAVTNSAAADAARKQTKETTAEPGQEPHEPQRSASWSSFSSASSLASLDTCDIMDDFLEELLMEVDGLSKVCIQLPSPPPAMSYCHRIGRSNASAHGRSNNQPGLSRRGRPTYSALNRRLNDGNNGFFSFFGGATEAHLNSKPLSTFLANLDRLAQTFWELEEVVQLRARELATDQEEEELRARLTVEYGLASKAEGEESHESPTSSTTPLQPSCTEQVSEALVLQEEADPLTATAFADRTTRQLFLSSPEHGRRSHGKPLSPGSATPPSASPLLRRPASVSLLLPTLVYAYPRVAAVSQHLDDEQQVIQSDYVATIAAARQQRREFTSRLREVFRLHVVPALQRRIAMLKQQQTSLARELGELGVKEVTLEWEEEEPEMPSGVALWQLMDEATAAYRRQWLGPLLHGGSNRSRSRFSAYSAGHEEENSLYGDDTSSRCLSMMRGESERLRRDKMRATASLSRVAGPPACQVHRRTLHVRCDAREQKVGDDTAKARAKPVSPRPGKRGGLPQQQRQHHRQTNGCGDEAGRGDSARPRSARLACQKSSARSGRRSTTATAKAPPHLGSKTCAALQLYTHPPSQKLLQLARQINSHNGHSATRGRGLAEAVGEGEEEAAAAITRVNRHSAISRPPRIAPIATSSLRCSGGTPRASGATGSSATARSSAATTTSARVSVMAPPSPRHRPDAPALSLAAFSTSAVSSPLVHDTRVRLSTDIGVPRGGPAVSPVAAAGLWTPFEPTRDALAEGAVHVAITFTGAEAHRRQVAQERREAYQREFWQLREELARIDEDIFQLRAKHSELCELQQRTEAEQEQKLVEAEAKVKKCRAFHKALKRENKEWRDICDELQRVIREEGES
ncbi:hypothetical protein ABL78_0924 [Leptomonas seymouri]|uniref:Uncharacterized protein n=1 Tax=Leptomonas seymouri TaxID=5684 RepID=A0A0N0P8H4_LEPSE|nr:hypothetical protein ABL78_0924 [Leptomonas seymouri]|eukprot:KPI89956.1 hypothetical protein ABL78_0924 [Leptomonas seymouri]